MVSLSRSFICLSVTEMNIKTKQKLMIVRSHLILEGICCAYAYRHSPNCCIGCGSYMWAESIQITCRSNSEIHLQGLNRYEKSRSFVLYVYIYIPACESVCICVVCLLHDIAHVQSYICLILSLYIRAWHVFFWVPTSDLKYMDSDNLGIHLISEEESMMQLIEKSSSVTSKYVYYD